ncbi:hypothetical protein C4J81_04395 [Deltaproteobacteria bacterium Smac51]|nr:hypothetical protein C4J81_04395 [Deltaproteobacteria bacterium Smac51]
MKKILYLAACLAATALFSLVPEALADKAKPYQPQHSKATIGDVKITLAGPAGFNRIDGLDQNLDDILLSTQPANAAALAIYAEPESWKAFNNRQGDEAQAGLHCHALITTPISLASEEINTEEFQAMMTEMAEGLKNDVQQKRDMTASLDLVSNHQVEKATGVVERFLVLDSAPNYITYSMSSRLDLKFKGVSDGRISRTNMVNSTILIDGKILNLHLMADDNGPSPEALAAMAVAWRASFTK